MNSNSESSPKKKHFSTLSFIGGLLVALFIGGVVYLFIPSKQKNNQVVGVQSSAYYKDSSIFSGEHFYRIHHHQHIDRDIEPIILMSDEESALEKDSLTKRQRKLIELLPNSPVIYLYDLKLTDYQKLYYQPNGTVLNIHDTTAPKLINKALKYFSNQQFEAAIANLKPIININRDDPNALFYTGAAYYYQKNYPQALIMLNRIGNIPNNVFKQEAYWYKAICFIDLQKTNEAKTLLQHIADAQGFYAARAKKQLALIK
ncbi:MAG: tetratricopeptide repeat protein [Bacteroidia bacterium]